MNDEARQFIDDYFLLGVEAWFKKYSDRGGAPGGIDPQTFVDAIRESGKELSFFDAPDFSRNLHVWLVREGPKKYTVYYFDRGAAIPMFEFDNIEEAMLRKAKDLFAGLTPISESSD